MAVFSQPPARTQRYCPACHRNVLATLDPGSTFNRAQEWGCAIGTCLLFLPFLILHYLTDDPKYLCPNCGELTRPAGRPPSASPQ